MKYKNYKNSYSKDDRIYSKNELYDMTLREILSRKEELNAQYRVLGLPDEKELGSSENVVHVEAYTREDGTEVKAHWRSKPNRGNSDNNISDANNQNAIKESSIEMDEQKKQEYIEKEREKSIIRKDPEEIAGVKQNDPRTFIEAVQQGVNPNIAEGDHSEYNTNCQSCTVANEMLRRGYDVEAVSGDNIKLKELSKHDESAYIDSENNLKCVPTKIDIGQYDCYEYLDNNIQQGERYEFSYYLTIKDKYNDDTYGHVVCIEKDDNNKIIIYDPQNNDIAYGEQAKQYIDSVVNVQNTKFVPTILRVDDKQVNPYYINDVIKKRR